MQQNTTPVVNGPDYSRRPEQPVYQRCLSHTHPVGNPYDNAWAETNWSVFKTDLLSLRRICLSRRSHLEGGHHFNTYFNLDRFQQRITY